MSKTYLPTIYRLLTFLCAFIAKHRDRIVEVLGDDAVPAMDALVAACHVFTAIILPFVKPTT